MKSQFELMKRNPQYFVFKFLNFYEQTFLKVFTNLKENKLLVPITKCLLLPFYKSKEVVLQQKFFNLVTKNNKVDKRRHAAAWFGHAAACLQNPIFTSHWHAAHAASVFLIEFTSCHGMTKPCRGMLSCFAQNCLF